MFCRLHCPSRVRHTANFCRDLGTRFNRKKGCGVFVSGFEFCVGASIEKLSACWFSRAYRGHFHVHDIHKPNRASALERVRDVAPMGVGIALAAALVAPRAAAGSLVILALVLALPMLAERRRDRVWPLPAVMFVLAAFGGYIAINALWSINRGEAYGKVLFVFVAATLAWLAITGISHLARAQLERLAKVAIVAIALGAFYLFVEVVSNQAIKRAVMVVAPFVQLESGKHMRVVDGRVAAIHEYVLNRNMAVLVLFLGPALLLIQSLLSAVGARIGAAALLAITALALFKSEHETSMLALIFAGVTFAGMSLAPTTMRRLVFAGWITATLLVVPIAAASYAAGLHQAPWIPQTGRNRIILWGFTAKEVRAAPILGTGVASTKELDSRAGAIAVQPADHTYPLRTGRHSHNIFMQTWYELGAVGAFLLLGIGLAALSLLTRLPRAHEPYAMASFVSAVIIGCFSWGMWQTWFMATYAVWAVVLALALATADRRRDAAVLAS